MSIQVDRPSAVIVILYEISKRRAQTYRIRDTIAVINS